MKTNKLSEQFRKDDCFFSPNKLIEEKIAKISQTPKKTPKKLIRSSITFLSKFNNFTPKKRNLFSTIFESLKFRTKKFLNKIEILDIEVMN